MTAKLTVVLPTCCLVAATNIGRWLRPVSGSTFQKREGSWLLVDASGIVLVDIQQTPTGLTNETEDEEDDDDNDNDDDDDDDEHKTLLRLDDDARTKQNMVFYKHRGWFCVLVPSVFWFLCLLMMGVMMFRGMDDGTKGWR